MGPAMVACIYDAVLKHVGYWRERATSTIANFLLRTHASVRNCGGKARSRGDSDRRFSQQFQQSLLNFSRHGLRRLRYWDRVGSLVNILRIDSRSSLRVANGANPLSERAH